MPGQTAIPEDAIGASEAARHLGVSSAWVRQLALAGTLPAVMTPIGRLFSRQAVEQLARERAERREVQQG